jgi:AraC-like DNA-binding protein
MVDLSGQHFLVRLGALSGIDRTLRELGVDPEPVLAAHGLSPAALAEGDRLIAAEQATDLLEHAARAANSPHFALELASRQGVNLLGAMGLLVQTADTVRDALQDVERYQRTSHASHMHWTLVRRGEFEAFEVSTELQTMTAYQRRLGLELAVSQCYRIIRAVTGGRVEIASVCFRHGDEQALPVLRRYFQVPVQLRADFDGLLFAPGALEISVARADTQIHETVARLLAQQTSLSVDSLAEQVKVLIRPLLPTGQCRIERIARCFNCDKRTLQRHLREESGSTYQQLLDEVRFEAACFYLEESDLSITQVAQLAGFSEPTNFSRAFRSRIGLSPRDWRRTRGAGGASSRRLSDNNPL